MTWRLVIEQSLISVNQQEQCLHVKKMN